MTRLLLAAAVVCALVSSPRRAEACWNNYSSESKVLGVANDGSFATYETSWSEAGDGASHEIVVHDAHGERIESFSLDPGRDTWIHAVEKSARGKPELARIALGKADVAHARAAITKALALTPLQPIATKFQHVKSGVRCGSIVRQTAAGFVRIADVGEQDFLRQFCQPVTASGFSHPASKLEFVRSRWAWGKESTTAEYSEFANHDGFTWYPKTRIEGLELALRGQRELDAGRAKEALPMLVRSIALAPEYVPSRRAVVWASAQVKAPWADLQRALLTPISGTCVAWAERDDWMDLPRMQLPWKEADELTSVDTEWPWYACRDDGFRFYRVNAKGEAVE